MKYRIVKEIDKSGKIYYYAQKRKWWWFWWYTSSPAAKQEWAQEVIDGWIKTNNTSTITYINYPTDGKTTE